MADLLHWILIDNGVTFLLHYLDDFLLIGIPGSSECRGNLDIIIQVCKLFPGDRKSSRPCNYTWFFLGILLDTIRLEARLAEDKLSRVYDTIAEWLD